MSLYNLLHGTNPVSPLLLAILDIDQPNNNWSSGRFRDIYFDEDGEHIVLYTRNGGGNREHWANSYDGSAGFDCPCPGCTIQYKLRKHPQYVTDWDDDYDCTYAYVKFTVPEAYRGIDKDLSTGKKPLTVSERFARTIHEMKDMEPEALQADPRFRPLIDIVEKISS